MRHDFTKLLQLVLYDVFVEPVNFAERYYLWKFSQFFTIGN